MVAKVALAQVFLLVLQFSSVSIIPPILDIHSLIYQLRYVISSVDVIIKKT